MKQIKLFKIKIMLTIILVASLTACVGGGSSSSDSDGGGGNSGLNIQSIATIGSILNSKYNPSCIYAYGNLVYLINGDNSGTGYTFNTSTGQVASAALLPKIDLDNGDQCLPNYQQLTWINSSNPYVINVFNPDTNNTTSIDLRNTGILAAEIAKTSFNLSSSTLYANNNFQNNESFSFSWFTPPNPTTYSELNNNLYSNRSITRVLYGFNGAGGQFFQLFPANSSLNLPAAIANIQLGSGLVVQNLATITDTNSQVIPAMISAWDFTPAGKGIVITTGAVQPVLYKCPLFGSYSYQCSNSYTGTELTTKYRIMRLLGGNANQVFFLGMDLAKADIEIFSLQL